VNAQTSLAENSIIYSTNEVAASSDTALPSGYYASKISGRTRQQNDPAELSVKRAILVVCTGSKNQVKQKSNC